jgi:ABC-type multidrug transport system fused ATPase/permease subunit
VIQLRIKNLKLTLTNSTVLRSFDTLSIKDRKKLTLIVTVQSLTGLLDLLGVAMIGVLGALAVNGVQSKEPGNRVSTFLSYLHLSQMSFQGQVAILGGIAASLLILRTIISVILTRRILFFLSRRAAVLSSNIISKLLSQPLLKIQERSTQESLYTLTSGVSAITVGVLGNIVGLLSDGSLLIIMFVGLFIVDPVIALGTLLVFSTIGLLIYFLLHQRARLLGERDAMFSIKSNETIVEVLNSYRELLVRNRREYYSRQIAEYRMNLSNTQAESAFMPNISKYVIELTIVLGAFAISAFQFMSQDASHAVASLSVFLAAGTRIAPAVLRIQQSALAVRGALGAAIPTLGLIRELRDAKVLPRVLDIVEFEHPNFNSTVDVQNIVLRYPSKQEAALKNLSFTVQESESLAIVGPSGAGKTSLVDVILGILEPQEGKIFISGLSPIEAIEKWPGSVAYVPQDVMIANGSIRENVALGYPASAANDDAVARVLDIAQLSAFVAGLAKGIDTQVGERGAKLSGGQRQRLGIARAMFTNPRLLILDEATSALDGQTEADIAQSINQLKGHVTLITIAHRLSTVRSADRVAYMQSGRILAIDTFEEVRKLVPDFDSQAKLMGL